MTASAVALDRLGDEVTSSRPKIEATLALGATAREAAAPFVRRALRSGTIALIDALLGSTAIAALVATGLAYRNFFTPAQQLRELDVH